MNAGSIHTVTLRKQVKLKDGGTVTKISTLQGQVHVPYGRTAKVRQEVEDGLRDEPTLPPWAEQVIVDNVRLWQHKGNGRKYFPLRPCGNKPLTSWVDSKGEVIQYDSIESRLYARDKKREKAPEYVIVAVDNLESIR